MSSGNIVRNAARTYEDRLNEIFESEQVDHRMRNGSIIDVVGVTESDAINQALKPGGPFTSAQAHVTAGLRALSNRRSPNTLEAVREAIHAAESAARVVTGADTLADALKTLQSAERSILHSLAVGKLSMAGHLTQVVSATATRT